MKFRHILFLSLLVTIFPLSSALTCKPSQQRLVYNSLYSLGLSVNTAYSGYLDLIVQGKVSTVNVAKISGLYTEFQKSFGAAEAVAQYNSSAAAPANLVDSGNHLIALIAQVKGVK